MYCRHLTLTNFRNYVHLDLSLSPRLTIFWGDNGQGKSNLIEALYVLATTKSYRTAAEREMVNWHVVGDPVFARVVAEVERQSSPTKLEVILAEAPGTGSAPPSLVTTSSVTTSSVHTSGATRRAAGPLLQTPAGSIRRRVRVNGQVKQPLELLGQLNVVLFSPEDVELVAGPAALRRRYLDITLCQIDHVYARTARRYERVLQQRNALLREGRERPVRADQFEYWDVQLVELGAAMIIARLRAVHFLNEAIARIYPRLAGEGSGLRAEYRTTVPIAVPLAEALCRPDDLGRASGEAEAAVTAVREGFSAQLATGRGGERQQAVTLVGPHRDDAGFFAADVDLRVYGSRGQQRAAALCLKLAEVELMQRYTGERPVLLLDDVMSELDPRRRRFLQMMVQEQDQVLLTATDLAFFDADFLRGADVYQVVAGALSGAPNGS